MNKNNDNGVNGLANRIKSGLTFFYPAGGGDLKTTEEVFDYWKRTGYSYSISCREFPTFRAALVKQQDGSYELLLFNNDNPATVGNPDTIPSFNISCGKRLTSYTKNWVMENINWYIKENYIDSHRFKVIYTTPDNGILSSEIIFNNEKNALAFIALIEDEALTNPGYWAELSK